METIASTLMAAPMAATVPTMRSGLFPIGHDGLCAERSLDAKARLIVGMDRNHNACLPAAGRIRFTPRAPVACLFGWCNGQPNSPSPTLALGSADHPFGIVAFCDSGRVSPNASRVPF